MLQSKKKVLNTLIDAFRPFGDVLQVGFSEEYAAEQIEKFHPKTFIILESDPTKAKKARKWAKGRKNVSVIEDFWENALPQLGIFDAVFLDKKEEGFKMRCSEAEIERLCKEIGKSLFQEMGQFLYELEHSGQISSEFRKKMVKKYHLKVKAPAIPMGPEPLFPFLEKCLQNHMRKGSRFCSVLRQPISQYEDAQFFEKVVVDPFLDCKEWKIREMLVILIEKL